MGRSNSSRHEIIKKIMFVSLIVLLLTMPLFCVKPFKNRTISSKLLDKDVFLSEKNDSVNNEGSLLSVTKPSSGDVVIESTTGRIMSGKNYDAKLPMASTTKVVTAAIAVNSGKLDEIVTIPKEACDIEGSSIYLREGEKLTLRDLVYGLMLRSGNDAATAIALYLGGSIDGFASVMNDYARSVGANNTNFVNPHGLHDDNHYTTAYDLAIMTAKALENPEFRKIVSCKNYKIESEGFETRYIANKNKMLNMYDGAIGVKTGYTKAAGRCLVSAAERDGVTAISVVLNEPNMWEKSISNLDYAFNNCRSIRIGEADKVIGNYHILKQKKTIYYGLKENADYVSFDKNTDISYEISIDELETKKAKIGGCVGKISFYAQKHLIFERKLYTIDIEEINA